MPDHKSLSIDIVKELINQQREDFSRMMETLLNSFNTRYDKLHSEVLEFKHSLEFSQRQIDDIAHQQSNSADSNHIIKEETDVLKDTLEKLTDKVDYIENQTRRNNIVFEGIPESSQELWEHSEEKIISVLQDKMGFTEIPPIERAHRVGRPRAQSAKPRPIVAKFNHYKDRDLILRNGRRLKGSNVYVKDDVSERVLTRRKEQMDKMKQAKEQGKIAYFILDRLVIKDRKQRIQSTEDSSEVNLESDSQLLRPNTRAYSLKEGKTR